jgi:hypothetical protein
MPCLKIGYIVAYMKIRLPDEFGGKEENQLDATITVY